MLIARAGSGRLILKARLMCMVCSAVVIQKVVKHVLELVNGDCPLHLPIPVHLVQFPDLVRVILQGQLLKPAGRGAAAWAGCRARIKLKLPARVRNRRGRHLKANGADVHSLAAD